MNNKALYGSDISRLFLRVRDFVKPNGENLINFSMEFITKEIQYDEVSIVNDMVDC